MIYIEDLMVGNWVNTKDLGIVEVHSINGNRELVFSGEWGDYDLDYICPKGIPVTPELLERIGFKKEWDEILDRNEWYYTTDTYQLLVVECMRGISRDWNVHIDDGDRDTLGGATFNSLHELQNLVRVITGKDLPITKEMLG